HQAGDKAGADRALKQALETARKIEEDTPLHLALMSITRVEVVRGDAAAALRACEAMENESLRAGLVVGVVREQAEIDPKEAQKTAEGLKDRRAAALAIVASARARALVRAGKLADALKEAARLELWENYRVRVEVASAHARAKAPAEAKAVLAEARRLLEKEFKDLNSGILMNHAIACAEGGDARGALETFAESKFEESKSEPSNKAYHYWRLARACAQVDAKTALRFADGLKDGGDRFLALVHIGKTQAEAKDKAGATETLEKARKLEAGLPADRWGSRIRSLAEIEADIGDTKAALTTARAAKKGRDRGQALLGVGRILVATDRPAAARILAEAAAELAGEKGAGQRSLPQALNLLTQAGQAAQALEVADKEKSPASKVKCLLNIVLGMNAAKKREDKKP
ncbi:MAG: hypothetical protein K2W96_14355, partial [Gemmataceae bacterium]|nr:hypothetical protein [Gemmataceae bacterium]